MKLSFFFISLFFSSFLFGQVHDSLELNYFYSELKPSFSLSKSFSKLNGIREKKSKENFNVIHFGDSHIQGDFFSGEIRRLLQSEFGSAGQGIIFPYALCKSFGPKGVKASTKGGWIGSNILKNVEKRNMGCKGYRLFTSNSNAELSIEITNKFVGKTANRIAIWTSADSNSFDYKLDKGFKLIDEKFFKSNLKYRTYECDSNIRSFNLSLIKADETNKEFYFHGFEFISNAENGVNYHQCGVVGAQFTHLIYNAQLLQDQIKQLKPDLIIFSFGTNEAYEQKIDTNFYYQSISDFIQIIRNDLPNVEFIVTTAPDTRSQGRTPTNQQTVNRQLIRIAQDLNLSLFDLNKAMGGWGSLYRWFENKLTLDDKLHFNSKGYSLQGKIFSHAFLKEYYRLFDIENADLENLENELQAMMQPIFTEKKKLVLGNENIDMSRNTVESKNQPKSTVYTIKSGDTLSVIAKRHNSSVHKILKANKLNEKSVIYPNQQIIIPAD